MRFDGSVVIGKPPNVVFSMLADIQEWATLPGSPITEMVKLPTGPTQVGTRWREVVSLGLGRSMTMWSEVSALEPDRLLALQFWGGFMRGQLLYTLEPVDRSSTLLRQQEWMRTVGCLRPFDRLVGRMLLARLSGRMEELRTLAESLARGRPSETAAGLVGWATQQRHHEGPAAESRDGMP